MPIPKTATGQFCRCNYTDIGWVYGRFLKMPSEIYSSIVAVVAREVTFTELTLLATVGHKAAHPGSVLRFASSATSANLN